jgi:hypothetical protein
MLRQYQHDGLSGIDGVNNLAGIRCARRYVPRRDPARHADLLHSPTGGLGDGTVWRGVAYKYVVRAGMSASRLLFAAAFSHVDPPPTSTSCWQKRPVFIKVYCVSTAVRVERRL